MPSRAVQQHDVARLSCGRTTADPGFWSPHKRRRTVSTKHLHNTRERSHPSGAMVNAPRRRRSAGVSHSRFFLAPLLWHWCSSCATTVATARKAACEEVYRRKLPLAIDSGRQHRLGGGAPQCHLPYDISTLRRARSAFSEDLGQEVETE
jgi:hypothetical protein